MDKFNEICITLDIDWASDEIIEYSLNLLNEFNIKATIFATHKSDLLGSLSEFPGKFEIAIHPNLDFETKIEKKEEVRRLLQMYPNAIGVRSHGGFQSTNIFRFMISKGLKYDSSTYIPLREHLYPWTRLKKLVCIPIFWCDDTQFYSGMPFDFLRLYLFKSGLKVYVFHPIHIFMNTQSGEHYKKFKPFYHQMNKLTKLKGKGSGTKTLFIQLLRCLKRNKIESHTCREIYEEWMKI